MQSLRTQYAGCTVYKKVNKKTAGAVSCCQLIEKAYFYKYGANSLSLTPNPFPVGRGYITGATAPRPCRGLRPCDPIFIIDRGFSTVLQQTAGAISCCFCFSLFKYSFPLLVIRHIPCKLFIEPCTVICLQKVCELVGNDIFRRRQRIFHKMNVERKYLL